MDKIDEISKILIDLQRQVDDFRDTKDNKGDHNRLSKILHFAYSVMLILMFIFSEIDHKNMSNLANNTNLVMQKAMLASN